MTDCRIEVEVHKGAKSMAYGVKINGVSLPNVTSVAATYTSNDARRVLIEFIPTDFIEIEREESEQTRSASGTVSGS